MEGGFVVRTSTLFAASMAEEGVDTNTDIGILKKRASYLRFGFNLQQAYSISAQADLGSGSKLEVRARLICH